MKNPLPIFLQAVEYVIAPANTELRNIYTESAADCWCGVAASANPDSRRW